MAERPGTDSEWVGRLVRVLLVFRGFVLLVTFVLMPSAQHTPVVDLATVLAALISYVPLRRWSRIAPSLSRHPAYLALEVLLATFILAASGARSPFFFFTLGTAVLAGIIYGRRGAIPFSLLLMAGYELVAVEGLPTLHRLHDAQSLVFAPLLYPVAVAAGIAARELVQRGVETEALLRERTEALAAESERVRMARELHDSLAKTVEGLAMAATVLPRRCERDPSSAATLARQLALDASEAARQARALMSDLRTAPEASLPLADAVRRRAAGFATRSGIAVPVLCPSGEVGATLRAQTRHELLRILSEALINAERHGAAEKITVELRDGDGGLALSVSDDGHGLPEPVDLGALKAAGHFGLAGMHERARTIGGELVVRPGAQCGTVVSLQLPAAGRSHPDGADGSRAVASRSRGLISRARGLRWPRLADRAVRE